MLQLLINDIEGVITPGSGGQTPWDLSGLLALRAYLSANPPTYACTLCSGRQVPFGEAILCALNWFYPLSDEMQGHMQAQSGIRFLSWPSILENGAIFYDPIAQTSIPHPILTAEKIQLLREVRAVLDPVVRKHNGVIEAGKEFCVSVNPPLIGKRERGSTDDFRVVVEQALIAYRDVMEINNSRSAVDITPHGISKASAVSLLISWSGLASPDICGIGDSTADAEWLALVGWRAAPANGRPFLHNLHYYASSEVVAGVHEIMQQLQENGYAGFPARQPAGVGISGRYSPE